MTLKLVSGISGEAASRPASAMAATGDAAALATAAGAAAEQEMRLAGLAAGCCFAFNPFQENV